MADNLLQISDECRLELLEQIEVYYTNSDIIVDYNGCHKWNLGRSSKSKRGLSYHQYKSN